ncbi:Mov34/MPN/PAD-1 family protein [Mycobacterium sp. KBS0706]|uniref:Mov34/MPN/PAD-1 family protein n=1 Tax=Mycobacterium sp. KBS0706 TaxID=2578109 RepID=UPI00163D9D78|nr:Mov34/MPN/PAD-1 family protein [Mycobacterium sp. KBS0706]
MISDWLKRALGRKPKGIPIKPQPAKLLVTADALDDLMAALVRSQQQRHEGIAYLLGRTDGAVTLAIAVFEPHARTTAGSFHVPPRAMISCMQTAAQFELQVVAQVHTHPSQAYHSDGDIEGAKIRYPGYASLVLPEYGRHLPSLAGAAAYLWQKPHGWIDLSDDDIIIIPASGPWTSSSFTTN